MTPVEWQDAPAHEGLWWCKRRGDIVCDVVQVTRNSPSFDGVRVEVIGFAGAEVWSAERIAEYRWTEARRP